MCALAVAVALSRRMVTVVSSNAPCAATQASAGVEGGELTQAREAGADVVLLKREALDAASEMPGGAEALLERLRYRLSGDD